MPVTALIGLQWGDEGKGKVVDALSSTMDVVVRAQGGANAGHTVKVAGKSRVLHLIPSGMLNPGVVGVVGNGVVVDPFTLLEEIDELAASGIDLNGRLHLSDRAHVVLPYHKELDRALEATRGAGAIGTTGRGIGPAYMDKAARVGLRVADLLDRTRAAARIAAEVAAKNRYLGALGQPAVDAEALVARTLPAMERLRPLVRDTVAYVHDAVRAGRQVMLEGAQGAMLDIDLGTYPYVTSSQCHIGGLLSGSGLPPQVVGRVIGVAKAYCTRVGGGPFPTEDLGRAGEVLRERGREYGATTGRPRRCGWFDVVAARWAARTNGVTEIALTKSDVLSGQPRIRVGVSYRGLAADAGSLSAGATLDGVEPVYEDFPGFEGELAAAKSVADLPPVVQDLIRFLESHCETRISLVSTGPERDQTVVA